MLDWNKLENEAKYDADGEVRHSVERVEAAREALGQGVDIMCDAHGTYTVSEAKRFCRMVEELNIAWFEEPVTADIVIGHLNANADSAKKIIRI